MAMTILKMAMMVRSFIEKNNTFLKARLQTPNSNWEISLNFCWPS